MTQEEKIIEILDRHFGHHVTDGSDEWYTRNYQNKFSDLQEIANWKEQQMIAWLKNLSIINYANCVNPYEKIIEFDTEKLIEDFKKAME